MMCVENKLLVVQMKFVTWKLRVAKVCVLIMMTLSLMSILQTGCILAEYCV